MGSTLHMVALGWWYWVLIVVLVAIIIFGLYQRKKQP